MAIRIFQHLSDRRVPQVLAVYVGASWGLVEFTSFLEERYLFSPHWTDVTLLALALLLPSVVLFTYNHGRPGKDQWTRSERVLIPANFILVFAVLFTVFSGKELGAVTTVVTVTDENGEQIERVVAKSAFRKRFALFNFDVPPGDTAAAWLAHGVPIALDGDLAQDIFVDVRSAAHFRARLREMGYPEATGVPVPLQRRIAQELHLDHFVNGRVTETGNEVAFTVSLYDTRRGRLMQERSFRGPDLFALIDEASLQLRRDLGLPARHLEEATDLGVAHILTGSLPTFRDYVEASVAIGVRDDWPAAMAALERAVAREPSFAMAQLSLFRVYLFGNQIDRAMAPLQAAIDHSYRLTERAQYLARTDFYLMRQEPNKALAVAQMWGELFSEDIQAHSVLAQLHLQRDEVESAIGAYERILEIDPAQHAMLLHVAKLQERLGRYDEAQASYGRYAERFPEDRNVFVSLGNLFRQTGRFREAEQSFQRALVIDPGFVDAKVRVASLARDQGRFDDALRGYQEALAASRTPEERSSVYGSLFSYHDGRGEAAQAARTRELWVAELARFQPPFIALQQNLGSTAVYVRSGDPARAFELLRQMRAQVAPPFDGIIALGEMMVHLELGNADEAEAAISHLDALRRDVGAEVLRAEIAYGRGRVAEIRGDCRAAITHYEEELRLRPADPSIPGQIGRCLRRLGDLRRAEQMMLRTLAITPFSGRANHEMGLVYLDMGNRARATEHLERAASIWATADPSFALARENRARLAGLRVAE